MATVSMLVERIVRRRPFLEEALGKGIINYSALAESIQPEIEAALRQKVKPSAVMMALRRLSEKLEKGIPSKKIISFKESDITLRSGLFEVTVVKSPALPARLRSLYDIADVSGGDFLAITQGMFEATIISNDKHRPRIQKALAGEKTKKAISGLSSLTIKIPIEAVETVGLFYVITKTLNWEDINIIEIVSTLTEMTFIVKDDDAPRSFEALRGLIRSD